MRAVARRGRAIALMLLLGAGVALVDDFGVVYDESAQQSVAAATLLYVFGEDDALLAHRDRTYGVAFEVPLLLAQLALGLEDSRHELLVRHGLTHVFFLLGGLCCAVLVRRLTGSGVLAAVALLLFVLHPRIYAHSFVNTKDVPFLAMFMAALLLIHRAFAKDSRGAFALCGVGVGLLAGIRSPAVALVVGVCAVRLLDLLGADRTHRRHVLGTSALFAAASLATLYAVWPYLWADPVARLVESLQRMARHPEPVVSLFKGGFYTGQDVPWDYLPVWIAIATPPVVLLLGAVGVVATAGRCLTEPTQLLHNTGLRFEAFVLAAFLLPVVHVALSGTHLYNGWRQMYFLYGPLVVLAALGLRALAAAGGRVWRRAVSGLALSGVGATVLAMALIHPLPLVYFNYLVDRATPGHLRARYDMDYYEMSFAPALAHLLARLPSEPLHVHMKNADMNWSMLPAAERTRVFVLSETATRHADYYITNHRLHIRSGRPQAAYAPSIHDIKVYNNTVASVLAVNVARVEAHIAAPFEAAYRRTLARTPTARAEADIHWQGRALTVLTRSCAPADTWRRFVVNVYPREAERLPNHRRAFGFEDLGVDFGERGVRVHGDCMVRTVLPPYPIERIEVGQFAPIANKHNERLGRTVWLRRLTLE